MIRGREDHDRASNEGIVMIYSSYRYTKKGKWETEDKRESRKFARRVCSKQRRKVRNVGERIKRIDFFLKSLVKRKESEKQKRKKKTNNIFFLSLVKYRGGI